MKTKTAILLAACAQSVFFAGASLSAQTPFTVQRSGDNLIELSGASTLHDWTMETRTFAGSASFELLPGNFITGLHALELTLPVTEIKSKKRALHRKAWKILKAEKFGSIDYRLSSSTVIGQEDYKTKIATVGLLSISGTTREVAIDIYCMANKGGSITCTGAYRLKMSDYGVDPPYLLDGLLSTSESVDLKISVRFER